MILSKKGHCWEKYAKLSTKIVFFCYFEMKKPNQIKYYIPHINKIKLPHYIMGKNLHFMKPAQLIRIQKLGSL